MSRRKERSASATLATPGFAQRSLRLARWIGARHVLGYAEPGRAHARLDIALPYDRDSKAHEVERVFGLLKALGINGPPPSMQVFPDAGLRRDTGQALDRLGPATPVVALHISARSKNQQSPTT